MLRQLDPFFEWVERDKPALVVEAMVARFILYADRSPWQAPSVPENDLSDLPRNEVRKATLLIAGAYRVYLLYRQHFELDGQVLERPVVDLIALSLMHP